MLFVCFCCLFVSLEFAIVHNSSLLYWILLITSHTFNNTAISRELSNWRWHLVIIHCCTLCNSLICQCLFVSLSLLLNLTMKAYISVTAGDTLSVLKGVYYNTVPSPVLINNEVLIICFLCATNYHLGWLIIARVIKGNVQHTFPSVLCYYVLLYN